MSNATTGGFKSFLVNGLAAPFRVIGRCQRWIAETVPRIPGYDEVNAAATQVTWPLRAAADFAVRRVPGVTRVEWLLETRRLAIYPPILLALTLLFVLWRGLSTTNLGHIGTDLAIYPLLASISVFNPFLGFVSGFCFGVGDLLQKLVINDMYGTPRGMLVKYGSLNYWGAIVGYTIAYSSVMLMGLAPGITSRLFRQGTRLALRKVFYRQAAAAADGATPPGGGFGVRVFVRTRPDGTLEYQAGARTPGPGWEPHTGPMSKEEASALLDRVQHGESLSSDQGPVPPRPGGPGPGQVSTSGSQAKADWTRPTGVDGGETRRYSPWTTGAADAAMKGIAGPGMVKGEATDSIKGAIDPADGPPGGIVDGGVRRYQPGAVSDSAGPGQVWGRSQGKGEVPAGGGVADEAIRRYQPGALADLKSAGLGEMNRAGIGELKNAGLGDLKSAGIGELKNAGLSDMKSAGLSEMKSAGLSEMKSAGLSEMKSAGLSEMKSAGLSEMKSAGLSEMKSAGLSEMKSAGLSELKSGDPWGRSDIPFDQPTFAPPAEPPPSSPPRRRRPVPPPPAAFVPPPAPSDVPVDPQPLSPRRKPKDDDKFYDAVLPDGPEIDDEIVCPPPDDLDDLLDDLDGPDGPDKRNRSPYDPNDGGPVYPVAEFFASIIGALAGGFTAMHAAVPLERSAFYLRPNPDVSCFKMEAEQFLIKRAGPVGLEGGLGGNAAENLIKRPPEGGGDSGGGKAAGVSPQRLSQEQAADLRSQIEKAEESYAFMGNEALQDRKTELLDRLERGEFVDEAEVNRLLLDAGQNLGAYLDDVARKDAISDQISQHVKDTKDAAEARQDDLFSQLYTLEDEVSGYFKTDKDGNEVWVEGRLSSAAGLGRMDMWHDRVVKDGTIDEAELLNMKESMEGARSMELDADMRRHLALEEANQNADYVVRQAQNAAVVVAIAATGGAAAGAIATTAGLGTVGTAAVGYGVGVVGGAAGGGAISYMDGGPVIKGALMGGGAALVLGPIGMGLGAGAAHVAKNVAPSLLTVIASPIVQGAGMGFGFTAAQRAITGEGDLLEGTFLGAVGGWGAHGGTTLGNKAAAPFAPPPKPAPGPRTSEPDYLGIHDEVGPHYDANRRILEGVGGDDLIGPRGSRVSDDTIFTGQPREDFNVTRPGGSRGSDDTIATGPFREDVNQTRAGTRRTTGGMGDDTIETPLSRRDTIETRPRVQDLDQTQPGTTARDGGKLVNPIDPADLKLPPPGELPWSSDVDAIAGKYTLKEINQAIDHARVHNPRAVPMLESARHNRFSSGVEFQPPAAPQRQGPPAWFEEPIVPSRGSVDDINLSRPAPSNAKDPTIATRLPADDFNQTRPASRPRVSDEPTIETRTRGQDLNRTRPATTDDGPGTGVGTRNSTADDVWGNKPLEELKFTEQLAREHGDPGTADEIAQVIRQRVAAGEVDAPRGIRPSAADVDAMGGNAIPEPQPGPRSIKPNDLPEPGPAPRKSPLPERPDALDWSEFQGPREDALPEFRSQVPDRPRVPFDDGLPADATRRGIDPADDPRIAKATSEPVGNRTRTGSEFDDGAAPRSSSTRDNITPRDQGTSSQRTITGREDGGTSPRNVTNVEGEGAPSPRNVTNVEGEGAPSPRNVTANEPGAGRPAGKPVYNPDDVVVTGKRPTQEQMDNLFRTRSVDELVTAQQKALADGDQRSAMMLQHVLEAKGHRPVIDPDLIPPRPRAGELPSTKDIEAIAKQYTEQQLRAARDAATDPHQRQILDQAADTRWGMAKEGTGQSWQPPHVRDVPRDIPKVHLQKGPELTQIPTEMPAPRPGTYEPTIVEGGGPRLPSRPIIDAPEPQVRPGESTQSFRTDVGDRSIETSTRRVVPAAEESDLPPLKPASGGSDEGQVLPKAEGTHHANEGGYSAEALARMQQNRFFRRSPDGKLIEINDPSAIDQQAFGRDVIVQVDKTTGQQTVTSWGDRIQPTERTGIRARLNEELGQNTAARPPVSDEASIENSAPSARAATEDVAEPSRPPSTEEPAEAPRGRTIDDPAETSAPRLSPEEVDVLRKYTGNEFIRMNEALRSGDPDAIAPFRSQIDQGVAALEKLPAERGTFYRGIDVADADAVAARYRPGETVTEDYFVSTSQNPGDELGGNIKFRVTTKSARDVSGWSPNPESEMLIPPGKRFFVKESYTDHDGNRCIVMEEVD